MAALVVTGLLVIADALRSLSGFIYAFQLLFSSPAERSLGVYALIGVLLVFGSLMGFGTYLILNRAKLANRWFDDDAMPSVSARDLLRTAIVVMGLALIAWATADVLHAATDIATARLQAAGGLSDFSEPSRQAWAVASAVAGLAQIALGAFLIAWSESLTARHLGLRPSAAAPAVTETATCPECGAAYNPEDYVDLSSARCSECRNPLAGA